ncbi:MAG: transporter substrate-binding domain-containing protein [Ruminococcaceae bacterium]|nr:transporter substrate-binding domain-containing protein [Oscillospiraceae bacterium]
MKKLLCLALAVVMVMSFVACGTTTTNEEGKQTSYDNLAIACELTSEEYGIGFRKGSDLVAEVDKIMADLNADGTLDALAKEYELTLVPDAKANFEGEATVKDLDYIKANGKMVIGITEYEPMNYKDANGAWTGFDTEFAEAVCEKLGVTAEFVEIDWDNKFLALESKSIDCIWNGMTISKEVLLNTSCSKAYVKNAQVAVVAKDKAAQYKTAADMKELKFAVEAGSAGAAAAEENGLEFIEANTQTDALLEVTSGSSDACIIDLTMANSMLGTK